MRTMESDWELLLAEPKQANDADKARDLINAWCKTSGRPGHDHAVASRVYERLFGERLPSEEEELAELRQARRAVRVKRDRKEADEGGI